MKKAIVYTSMVCVMFFVGCSMGNGQGINMPGSYRLDSACKTAIMNATKNVDVDVIDDWDAFKTAVKACDSHERMIELLFNALYMYEIKGKEIADKMMVEILDPSMLLKSNELGQNIASHLDKFLKNKEIIHSYFDAQPPAYEFEYSGKFTITLMQNKTKDMSKGAKKYFIRTAGKDFDSPLVIRQYEGNVFKVYGLSSLSTGVRKILK